MRPYIRNVPGAALLFIFAVSACSGIKPYPGLPNKNLHLQTVTDSESLLAQVDASVHIYSVDADCAIQYKGTVQLDSPGVDIGLPPKQQSYLVFTFATSGFLSNSSGTTAYNALLNVRPGYRYSAKVSYIEGIYKVVIHEMNPAGKQSREIELRDLDACMARL